MANILYVRMNSLCIPAAVISLTRYYHQLQATVFGCLPTRETFFEPWIISMSP
jgi:hypothetical protein